ncbi:hypothetical protein EYZ11_003926 [Aspergillus tanneri]|nr:hypothetical protein EYZ11_003926 [Aspergillus tanneri]
MPVPDLECTYRVAALVRFRHGYDRVNLHTLREHMSAYLPIYQLPTLLRVLEEQNAVPRALSTKISLKKAVAQYFRQDEERNCIDDEVEVLDLVHSMEMETPKAWALSSLQEVALNV